MTQQTRNMRNKASMSDDEKTKQNDESHPQQPHPEDG